MKYPQYRQGDVLLVRVHRILTAAKIVSEKVLVLAEGEVTGHAHRIVNDDAVMLTTAEGATFVRLAKRAQLVHEEHARIDIAPGTYRVVRQREYEPAGIRRVSD